MATNQTIDAIKSASDRPDEKTIASQLAKPTGDLGVKVAEKMNEVNRSITKLVYDTLKPAPTDRILEIGFGNGVLLRDLASRVPHGRVDGIDISLDMVATATELLKDLIEQDKVDVQYGSIEEIPFDDGLFNGACSMNTIYFWENPVRAMSEVKRVVKPGGKFVLGLRSKRSMTDAIFNHGFTKYSEEDVRQLFEDSGFNNISLEVRDDEDQPVTPGVTQLEVVVIAGEKAR